MGGLDRDEFSQQLDAARSFTDSGWCDHWDAIAARHVESALAGLRVVIGDPAQAEGEVRSGPPRAVPEFNERLGTLPLELVDLLAQPASTSAGEFARQVSEASLSPESGRVAEAAFATAKALLKAITYYQVSAFPGETPRRMKAYRESRRLFEWFMELVGPTVGVRLEKHMVYSNGEMVEIHAMVPPSAARLPAVLISNGLEGTVQELAIPQLKYRSMAVAHFYMEMPGTYAYKSRMTAESEAIYEDVLSHIQNDVRVDPANIGFVGVSFGGYWAVRLAARSKKLRCSVANGAPTHRSFTPAGAIGLPEIIVRAMVYTTGARHQADLGKRLHALTLKEMYGDIRIPLFVLNGDSDSLLSTQDSVDVAAVAPLATLKLYPDDDHCAMKHYDEWRDDVQQWMLATLGDATQA